MCPVCPVLSVALRSLYPKTACAPLHSTINMCAQAHVLVGSLCAGTVQDVR